MMNPKNDQPNHLRTLFLFLVVTLHLSLPAQTAENGSRFSFLINDASLEQFVKYMEKETGYSFIYGEDVFLESPITLKMKDCTLPEALDEAFGKEAIGYRISGNHVLLLKKEDTKKTQTRKYTISGYITDLQSSETLIGANIVNRSSSEGTATNPYGFYSLTLPTGEVCLAVSYLGYRTFLTSFELKKDTVLNIRLRSHNQLDEVVVLSDKPDIGIRAIGAGSIEIPMTQIKSTPTILGEPDLLKTIQMMPGVQSNVEGFSGVTVRGGGTDENLVLLDGVPVYNADHMMGLFSIFTPEAIKKVSLYKGYFPASYGGRTSSVVDVRTNDGNMQEYHGTLSIGQIGSRLHLEGPIIKNRTSFSLSTRGTYASFLVPLLSDPEEKFNYYFYDLNAKLNHKFNDRSRLFLHAYRGGDHFGYTVQSDVQYGYGSHQTSYEDKNRMKWGNFIVAGRWNYVFNNKLFSNTTIAYNSYRMTGESSSKVDYRSPEKNEFSFFQYNYHSGIRDWTFRSDFDYTPNPSHRIRFGGEYLFHTFKPETSNTVVKENTDGIKTDSVFQGVNNRPVRGHEIGVYGEDNFDLNERLSMSLGMRFTLFSVQGKTYFSAQPRAAVRYDFGNGYSAKASFSQMEQYVHLLTATPISMPTDLWVPVTRNIRPMKSNQYTLGGYYTGISGWEFSVEGYYKQMKNVLEYQNGVSFLGSSASWEDKVEMGKGRAMGVEFLVQKTLGKTTGWIAYTLAKSDRIFEDGSINDGKRFPYKYDNRHNLHICMNHKFNDRIDISASWMLRTGGTMTIPERQIIMIAPDGSDTQVDYTSSRNNYRLPSTHLLNLGVNFRKKTRRGERIWNISLYNAYNAKNATLVYPDKKYDTYYYPNGNDAPYSQVEGKTILKKMTLTPILPSVSYTFIF